jgi:hypothetical protein
LIYYYFSFDKAGGGGGGGGASGSLTFFLLVASKLFCECLRFNFLTTFKSGGGGGGNIIDGGDGGGGGGTGFSICAKAVNEKRASVTGKINFSCFIINFLVKMQWPENFIKN